MLRELAEQYLATRIDATAKTLQTYRQAFAHLGPLGEREPASIRLADIQEWVSRMSERLAPATVRKYLDAIRQVLDFAEVQPNPARSRRLRLPQATAVEVNPPTSDHVDALLTAISPKYRIHVRVLDWTGLRVGELQALTWGDIDWRGGRLRVARGRTKGRTAGRRWVPLPRHILDLLTDLVPLEDRDLAAPVFPGLSDQGLRLAMTRGCKIAGVPACTPHDLRHRYISLLVMAGVALPVVGQVVGHSRASVTLDVYSHVLLDEPPEVLSARRILVERRAGDVPVMYGEDPQYAESPTDAGLSVGMEDTGLEPVTFALPARRSPS